MKRPQLVPQQKYLTWDNLADFYKKKTGGTARTKPMDAIYDWAIKQPEIKETEEGLLWSN
jgi:hypothetical protein